MFRVEVRAAIRLVEKQMRVHGLLDLPDAGARRQERQEVAEAMGTNGWPRVWPGWPACGTLCGSGCARSSATYSFSDDELQEAELKRG